MKHTNQSFFGAVCVRAKDKRKSLNGDRCVYRSSDGLACFVGVCIPDDEYHPDMEQKSAYRLANRGMLPFLADVDRNLMLACQMVHDNAHPDEWQQELRTIANKFSLEMPA